MLASKNFNVTRGTVLIEEGFLPCHLRKLESGLVRVTTTIDQRVETVAHLTAGDFFSTECITGGESAYGVDVLSESASYNVIFTDNLSHLDVQRLARALGRQAHRMALAHSLTRRGELRSRVARYLLALAHTPLAQWEGKSVCLRGLKQEVIASAVGCLRVHATRLLKVLEEEGLLSTRYRCVRLLDLSGLYVAAGAHSVEAARMLDALFKSNVEGDGVEAAAVIEQVLAERTKYPRQQRQYTIG